MSIKQMAKVFKLAVDSDTREILLALADHADHDGYSVYPSVSRLAWKIGDGSVGPKTNTMSWIHTVEINGKKFEVASIHGAKQYSLNFTHDQLIQIGNDLPSIIEWFKNYGYEWGLVVDWRAMSDPAYFTTEELRIIYNSRFASDKDREMFFPSQQPTYHKQSVTQKKKTPGYVYLIKGANDCYKIGRSKNAKSRIENLGVVLPFQIHPICIIKCDDMIELERSLHAKFQDKRMNGEWFALTSDDVEYIKSL